MYFSYHSVSGKRSYSRLSHLTFQLEQKSSDLKNLEKESKAVEVQVRMMRPVSLSADMLEERIVLLLGYGSDGDIVVIGD